MALAICMRHNALHWQSVLGPHTVHEVHVRRHRGVNALWGEDCRCTTATPPVLSLCHHSLTCSSRSVPDASSTVPQRQAAALSDGTLLCPVPRPRAPHARATDDGLGIASRNASYPSSVND